MECVLFQQNIDRIAAWCVSWQLKLNLSKCSWVKFGLAVKPVLNYKLLGSHYISDVSVWEFCLILICYFLIIAILL